MRRIIIVLVALAALAAAVAGFYYARIDERYQGFEGAEQFVEITPGTGSRGIGRALAAGRRGPRRVDLPHGGLSDRHRARAESRRVPLCRSRSPKEIARKLARGAVYLRPVTFPEGLTVKEMARIVRVARAGHREDVSSQAAADPGAIRALDPGRQGPRGLFVPRDVQPRPAHGARTLVGLMAARFLASSTTASRARPKPRAGRCVRS